MSAPARLAAFAALMAVVVTVAVLAGGAIDPSAPGGGRATAAEGAHDAMAGHAGTGSQTAPAASPVRGLAVAEHGLRLVLDTPELRRGAAQPLRFRILDERTGAVVRDYDVQHTKRLHLIVVRRDLSAFQHLHPRQDASGTWSVPVTVAAPGSYRVFADVSHDGVATTLATDLRVDGNADLLPLPRPARRATTTGGYAVTLARAGHASVRAGADALLRFTITRDGTTVRTQPYLGAAGHLVALREGDLAFLHVHPDGAPGPAVTFMTTFPSAGRYRLFLQFRHAGRVHTVAFTQEVSR